VERGYYITEGPPTVFSSHTQDIIRRVPLTCLLTETDGPVRYSRPPFKGKMTTPAFIPIVVEAIARIRGEEKLEVAEQICKNFVDFFEVELT
jgi:TatD DNase family protein